MFWNGEMKIQWNRVIHSQIHSQRIVLEHECGKIKWCMWIASTHRSNGNKSNCSKQEHYHWFMLNFSSIISPINNELHRNENSSVFGPVQNTAVVKIIILCRSRNTPILRHFNNNRQDRVTCMNQISLLLWCSHKYLKPVIFIFEELF